MPHIRTVYIGALEGLAHNLRGQLSRGNVF
jgi:hypothetical protein